MDERVILAGYAGENKDAPGKAADGAERTVRLGRRGEVFISPLFSKPVASAKEGSAFVALNGTLETGIATGGATQTAFVATTPSLWMFNGDVPSGKDVILDRLKLIVTVAGVALTALRYAVIVDNINRYTSGGTAITPRVAVGGNTSVVSGFFGAITASAAGGASKVVGHGVLRSQIPIINDEYMLDFGGSDSSAGAAQATTSVSISHAVAPVILAPGECMLVYLWGAAMTTTPQTEYEIQWYER
jgi:hypothetical protein